MDSEMNEETKLAANNKSFSHQLKFGVERLLSNDKFDYQTTKSCQESLNLQLNNNGYHSLNVNNNPCYRSGYSTSDLFVRNGAFFNYFHQKNNLISREREQQRTQILRPMKTEFNMPTTNSATNTVNSSNNVKRKRSWSRAVFSNLQRKGLERQFEFQKYITKPDRKKLAARLGLKDAQVKVWFQNRRMKWRHSTITSSNKNSSTFKIEGITSSSDDEDEEEIDVVSDVSYELG